VGVQEKVLLTVITLRKASDFVLRTEDM